MTAQEGKQPEGGQGRSGDIQARQTDDGSFELVVENPDASGSSEPAGDGSAQPEPRPTSRASGAKRLGLAIVVGLAVIGVLAYAFTGEGGSESTDDASQVKAGFRPYLGGPSNERSAAAGGSEVRREEPSFDEVDELDEVDESDEPNAAAEAEMPDEEREWEIDGDEEVVVLEEEHPPEETDQADEDEDTVDLPEKPTFDRAKLPDYRERINLPIQTPQLNHLPSPRLNQVQPQLDGAAVTGDEAYVDEEEQYDDEEYEDEEYEDEGYEGEGAVQEYDNQDDSFEEYDEGY
jgi:hypothetical protein